MNSITRRFESWDAFVNYAAPERPDSASRLGNRAWSGTASFSEALDLARGGWVEGLKRIRPMAARVEAAGARGIRWDVVRDVSGAWVDVGEYLRGVPECMVSPVECEAPVAGPIVTLVVAGSASSCVSADSIMRRGAACVSLVDALEAAGRRVEIVLSFAVSSHAGSAKHELRVVVKRADMQLSPEVVAFSLAHPASLRRIAFGAWEQEGDDARRYWEFTMSGGYGRPTDTAERGDVYVPTGVTTEFESDAAAQRWVVERLREQGVEVEA